MSRNPNLEFRTCFTSEVRMEEREGRPMIVGYGAVFNSRSQTLRDEKGREFVETIRPGAFRKAISECDVRALINHDAARILGRCQAGSMRLSEDARGLLYEVDPPDTSYARDLMVSLRRGDINGSSFSFATLDDDWSEGEGGVRVRELRAVHLFDVGPVTFPAYQDTSAACRSLDQHESRSQSQSRSNPSVSYPTPAQTLHLQRLRLAEIR